MNLYPYPVEVSFFNNEINMLSVSDCIYIFWITSGTMLLNVYNPDTGLFNVHHIKEDQIFLLNQLSLYAIDQTSTYEAFKFCIYPDRFKTCISDLFSDQFVLNMTEKFRCRFFDIHICQFEIIW